MKKNRLFSRAPSADRWGITLSAICLVHCLFFPTMLALLPVLLQGPVPSWMHETEMFHAMLLVPVLLISGPTLYKGGANDRRIWVLGATAFSLLCLALLAPTERMEQIITVTGACLLVVAHLLNLRTRQAG